MNPCILRPEAISSPHPLELLALVFCCSSKPASDEARPFYIIFLFIFVIEDDADGVCFREVRISLKWHSPNIPRYLLAWQNPSSRGNLESAQRVVVVVVVATHRSRSSSVRRKGLPGPPRGVSRTHCQHERCLPRPQGEGRIDHERQNFLDKRQRDQGW